MGKMLRQPIGTSLPDWKVIENEPEVDLRGILDQKKKKRERKEAFSNRSQLSDGRLGYRLWRYAGPSYLKQKGPGLNEANATPTCYCTQETAAPAKHSLNNIVETATPEEHFFDIIAEPC